MTKLVFGAFSIDGPRGDNQDCVLEPVCTGRDWWCAVADGVSGSDDGGRAARACIEAVKGHVGDGTPMTELFRSVRRHLRATAALDTPQPRLATTLSVLRVAEQRAFVGHVGDSRIMHFRDRSANLLTHDQTEVQKLLDAGVLGKYQARGYPRRGILLSAMASRGKYDLFENRCVLQGRDRVLLTTDGLHDSLDLDELLHISAMYESFDAFYASLRAIARSLPLADDTTCLAIEVDQ